MRQGGPFGGRNRVSGQRWTRTQTGWMLATVGPRSSSSDDQRPPIERRRLSTRDKRAYTAPRTASGARLTQ